MNVILLNPGYFNAPVNFQSLLLDEWFSYLGFVCFVLILFVLSFQSFYQKLEPCLFLANYYSLRT